MAELTHKEKLQPSLLDRLTDDAPEAKQESREARVLSPRRLRESVKRDLVWLFNTTALDAVQALDVDSPAARSVINYGMPDLAGKPLSSINVPALEEAIRRAIVHYEPRLNPESLRVTLTVDRQLMSHNAMVFDIQAELWAQPIPLRLFLRTHVDLETGSVDVSDIGGGG